MKITRGLTNLTGLIMCCVQCVKLATPDPGCTTTIRIAHQYITNPCGGQCLHLPHDEMMTQLVESSRRAIREITRLLIQYKDNRFLFPLPTANPELHLPEYRQNSTLEDTLAEVYRDLAVYFTLCRQIEQFERNLNPNDLHNVISILSYSIRVIRAGTGEHRYTETPTLTEYQCLSNYDIPIQSQKGLILTKMIVYFHQLSAYLLST